MPLITPGKCWRGRSDCKSLSSIEAAPDDITDEEFCELNFDPISFVCCGVINVADRRPPQDAYRLCFKSGETDEMSDNDDQDLAHLVAVISQAQAIIATRRVNSGCITTLDDCGGLIDIETEQQK